MPMCLNPECQKDLPEDKKCCNEDCVKQYLKLKPKKSKQQNPENRVNLTNEEDLWLGQGRRKRAMETIMKLAHETCPIPYKKFVCAVSYRTGLSYRKIADDYLEVLLEIGLLKRNDNILTVDEDERGLNHV